MNRILLTLKRPFIWLYRFRHRCGYGVHSPFAFNLITHVIYESTAYYKYEELAKAVQMGTFQGDNGALRPNQPITREQAFAKLLPRTHPGAVVLLHSTSKTNAEILDELLTKWEEEGYRFATVEELFAS